MEFNLPKQLALACALAVLVMAARQLTGQTNPNQTFPDFGGNQPSRVEEYLAGLQLDRLLIEHLEFETSRETDTNRRREKAARLTELYSQKMMSGSNDDDIWRNKTELLLRTYPQLATPSIRIAMLQSDYLSGEKLFQKWWKRGRPSEQTNQLINHWRNLKSDLQSLRLVLKQNYENQLTIMRTAIENREAESQRLLQTEGLLLHADYLMGWSSYFIGILIPTERMKFMLESDSHFREFLQIEPRQILNDVASNWIDFSSDWNARALVGLAMCQRGLNHVEQSTYCFDLIENHSPDQRTRDLTYVWDLNARLYLNDFPGAQKIIGQVEQGDPSGVRLSKSGKISFWLAVLNGSMAIKRQSPSVSASLIQSGLKGLARQFQAPLIETFVNENGIRVTTEGFLDSWIAGYLEFHAAENSNQRPRLESARLKLTRAIDFAGPSDDLADVARCRYLRARIDLKQGKLASAATVFLDVAMIMNDRAPELAAESQWLAARALCQQSRTNPRRTLQASRAIDQLLQRFPGSIFAKRAQFEKMKLGIANLDPDEAVRRLLTIDPTDSNYLSALNEITKIRYQAWLNAFASNDETSTKLESLLDAERELRQQISPTNESSVKASLLTVDALLRSQPVDLERARNRLDDVTKRVTRPSLLYQEYRYYEFQFANRSGDADTAHRHAIWLSENAKGTPYESSALIQLALAEERQLKSRVNPTSDEINSVIAVFDRLVNLLGETDDSLKQNTNARVAFIKLAELKLRTGETEKPIRMLETINQLIPNRRDHLRKLGLAYVQAKQYEKANQVWRKLTAGMQPGSDVWLEAKYQLSCGLIQLGEADAAGKVAAQTKLLAENMPDHWRRKFESLSEQFPAD